MSFFFLVITFFWGKLYYDLVLQDAETGHSEPKDRRTPAKKNRISAQLDSTAEEEERSGSSSPIIPDVNGSPPHESKIRQISQGVEEITWQNMAKQPSPQPEMQRSSTPPLMVLATPPISPSPSRRGATPFQRQKTPLQSQSMPLQSQKTPVQRQMSPLQKQHKYWFQLPRVYINSSSPPLDLFSISLLIARMGSTSSSGCYWALATTMVVVAGK